MSRADLRDEPRSDGWRVRPAGPGDLAGLQAIDGGDAAAPVAHGEAVWVTETEPGRPRVALRLHRRIGQPVPQAWFRLGWAVHASQELGLYRRQRTLLLGHDLTGADELAGCAQAPDLGADEAAGAWAALLAVALRAAADGEPDAPTEAQPCIVQLPGLRDPAGRSPVWDGLGRHFHAQEIDAARRQHGAAWDRDVADLLPRHLLYASLLPEAAQAALGQPASTAAALLAALRLAGFTWRGHVGIVDGGPVMERWPAGQ